MQLSFASAALAAAFVLTPVAAGHAPALSQDFSITNETGPADAGRRDLMRQLQAWWDVHAYYPEEASKSDVDGSVKVHLVIHPDGVIFLVYVDESSGSRSLDTAAFSAFQGGFVRPSSAGLGASGTEIDISVHFVLAHRHDQPVVAGYTQVASKRPFTITNDAVAGTVVDTMLQRTCTGNVVRNGLRNNPAYGWRSAATAVFFHKPDGKPWVKFWEGGYLVFAPVTEIGRMAQWTGREERIYSPPGWLPRYTQYTVWPDGDNHLSGDIDHPRGWVEFTCAPEVVPAITGNTLFEAKVPVQPASVPEALHYRPGQAPPSFKYP